MLRICQKVRLLPTLFLCLALISASLLAGCNAATGQRPTQSALSRALKIAVSWPKLNSSGRAMQTPSTALSATMTIFKARVNDGDFIFTVNRNSDVNDHIENYTSPPGVKAGTFNITVGFFSAPDGVNGTGALVGVLNSTITIAEDGSTSGPAVDASATSTINSLEITPQTPVGVGQQSQLRAIGKTNAGDITLGAGVLWQVVAGGDKLSIDSEGRATGILEGQATVRASIAIGDTVFTSSDTVLSVVATPTRPRFTVLFNSRSRSIDGPSSALSVVLSLSNINTEETYTSITVDRREDPASYIQTVELPEGVTVPAGQRRLMATFFAQPGGQGNVVGTVNTNVQIAANGSGVETLSVAYNRIVSQVEVVADQTLKVGASQQLAFTAKDADGNILALTPGSVFWRVTEGQNRLNVSTDGLATGLSAGTAGVIAIVDTVQSSPMVVTVTNGTGGVGVDIQ